MSLYLLVGIRQRRFCLSLILFAKSHMWWLPSRPTSHRIDRNAWAKDRVHSRDAAWIPSTHLSSFHLQATSGPQTPPAVNATPRRSGSWSPDRHQRAPYHSSNCRSPNGTKCVLLVRHFNETAHDKRPPSRFPHCFLGSEADVRAPNRRLLESMQEAGNSHLAVTSLYTICDAGELFWKIDPGKRQYVSGSSLIRWLFIINAVGEHCYMSSISRDFVFSTVFITFFCFYLRREWRQLVDR